MAAYDPKAASYTLKDVDSSKHWDQLGAENIEDADIMPAGFTVRKGKHLTGRKQFAQHAFYLADRKRVLDVPCGYGRYLVPISKNYDAVGVDLSQSLLKRCRQNIIENRLGTWLVRADLRYLPFRNDTFDAVLCLNSLYYVEPKYWSVIFTQVSNILSKDGEFDLNMQMRGEIWAAQNGFGSFVVLARIVYELEKHAWFRRLWARVGFRTFHGLYTFHTTRNSLVRKLEETKMRCVKITEQKRPLFVCMKQA
jgi:SAM-dependent methyltransferase